MDWVTDRANEKICSPLGLVVLIKLELRMTSLAITLATKESVMKHC